MPLSFFGVKTLLEILDYIGENSVNNNDFFFFKYHSFRNSINSIYALTLVNLQAM